MSKKSKIISARLDEEVLSNLNSYVKNNSSNKNKLINSLLKSFLESTYSKSQFKDIFLNDNVDKLDYKRNFLSEDESKFIINKAINQRKLIINHNLINQFIKSAYLTGIRYDLNNINLSVYSFKNFTESIDGYGSSVIEITDYTFYLNTESNRLIDLTEKDYYILNKEL